MKDEVKKAKATGKYPVEWFKGYTKMNDEELGEVLAKVAAQDKPEEPKPRTPSRAELAARGLVQQKPKAAEPEVEPETVATVLVATGPAHPAPKGVQTTPDGYPVTVVVKEAGVIQWTARGKRRLNNGEVFRGERAWYLWDHHNDLVMAR